MHNILVKLINNPGVLFDFYNDSGEAGLAEEGRWTLWKDIYTVGELQELLWQLVIHEENLAICYHDGFFSVYNPNKMVYALFLDEVVVLKTPTRSRLPQIRMGENVCTTMENYMSQYEVEENYLTRARMYTRINQWVREGIGPSKTFEMEFDPNLVVSLKPWENHFHKNSVIMEYKGIPPIFGLSKIRDTFPSLSPRDLKRLYARFDIPLPKRLR